MRRGLILISAWTFVGLFFAAHDSLLHAYVGRPEPFWQSASVYLLCAYTWLSVTPLIIRLSRRFRLVGDHVGRNALVHVGASFLFSAITMTMFVTVAPYVVPTPNRPWLRRFNDLFILELHFDLLRYWGVIGIEHAIAYYRQFRERELALAEARLEVLKRQLHPHFLFNTLNSISVLMFEDPKVANRMLLRLSELLRAGLTADSPHEVSLEHELAFLQRYLDIERMRFGDRLTVDVAASPDTLGARVPNLILQPIVENAIRYGVAAVDRPSKVSIRAEKNGAELLLQVRDDGPGMPRNPKRGVGLSNTEARLRQLYGLDQRMELSAPDDGGVLVRIAIPFRAATA